MTEITSPSGTIRLDLVEIATGFLTNPKISSEKMDRKREFLKRKGLTDTKINYAFELIPKAEIPSNHHHPSFFRRLVNKLTFAGFLVIAIQVIKEYFQSNEQYQFNETTKILQKSIENIRTNLNKLEQIVNQINSTIPLPNPNQSSLIEEIKQEIQRLICSKTTNTSDNDTDGLSKQDEKN